jgi:hypothetical protein
MPEGEGYKEMTTLSEEVFESMAEFTGGQKIKAAFELLEEDITWNYLSSKIGDVTTVKDKLRALVANAPSYAGVTAMLQVVLNVFSIAAMEIDVRRQQDKEGLPN